MPEILLTTLNARYSHASFGLRYLKANLGALAERTEILEFDLSQRPSDVLEQILLRAPKIVGVGVYIWNANQSLQLVSELKRIRPGITVVVGGPEVSYESDSQEICRLADFVITGEADHAFEKLCTALLQGRRPLLRTIPAGLPHFAPSKMSDTAEPLIALPYHLYTDADVKQRVVYVEASRGCPFSCEFCLSALDIPVRNVPLAPFLSEMQKLFDRGLRQFKFVDRTFNLNLQFAKSILQFFLERVEPGLFVHFEMIPDRMPIGLRDLIRQFPPGTLQFELGVQTLNPAVEALVSRQQDHDRLKDNLIWLRTETGVHVHADLIVGLPGEDLESFGRVFDELYRLGLQEIQVGMLKRLRGTPIVRHDQSWQMIYSSHPPYEVLQTKLIDALTMQRMRRFSRYWDLVANSGNFAGTLALLVGDTPFASFLRFSDWLCARSGNRTHGYALSQLAGYLLEFVTQELGVESTRAAEVMVHDFNRTDRDPPSEILKLSGIKARRPAAKNSTAPARQARHLGSTESSSV